MIDFNVISPHKNLKIENSFLTLFHALSSIHSILSPLLIGKFDTS